ncbi:uncharacterized protein LOC114268099 [Camellia sinensis]|uniref:uncharacterized protein LOC114268099 n=1 Tax=Camellia sinensis TaxID=4442 RepID=UPI001036268F|nr:uncharacterized protein LOC114268099 [Camellia sinensis]
MEIDSNSGENPLLNESEKVEEPKRGMCFSSKQEVYTFYAKYAKHVGFSIAYKTQRRLEINDQAGIGMSRNYNSMVVEAGVYESLTFDERDTRNYINKARRLRNLFWADAMSRAAYEEFGDVVSFDTTYLTNKYDMPFALFIGVNHHGQSILLGCGLLSSEDTDTFVWLFKSW